MKNNLNVGLVSSHIVEDADVAVTSSKDVVTSSIEQHFGY